MAFVVADNFSYTSVKKDFVKPVKQGLFIIEALCNNHTSV